MPWNDYQCLRIRIDRGVCFATIDHPPINLFDVALMQELDRLGREIEADPAIRVVVFDSADPDFFIAHADVSLIQQLPDNAPPRGSQLSFFHAMVDRFRTMAKVSIAKIEGRTRGGGSAFVDDHAYKKNSYPVEAVKLAKELVNSAEQRVTDGLLDEAHAFNLTLGTDEAKRRMAAFLAGGGQPREMESGDLGLLAVLLAKK